MSPATLRPMRADDADAVAALHATSWRHAYRGIVPDHFLGMELDGNRLSRWQQRWAEPAPGATGFVAVEIDPAAQVESRLVGFVYVFRGHDPIWGSLVDNLHVHPDHHGCGLGRRLLARVAAEVTPGDLPLHLWVLADNHRAREFYARLGAEFVESATTDFFGPPLAEWRCVWRDPVRLLDHA